MKRNSARTKKYFAPQDGGVFHKCDFPGCPERGEFRAPKDHDLTEYYWFCLKHVQEYNAKWSYYTNDEDIDDDSSKEHQSFNYHQFHRFSSKIHYAFGFNFTDDIQDGTYNFSQFNYADALYTKQEREYLKILQLSPQDELSLDVIKKQYKKLVKIYHPDLNNNNAEKEEQFKQLNNAYNELKKHFS